MLRQIVTEIANTNVLLPANPQIMSPIPFQVVYPRACNGYPTPPAGGDFISDPLSGNVLSALQKYSLWVVGVDESWVGDCISGRTFTARQILLIRTWSEATVGQVLSGYVRDQNEEIIHGSKVIITSTYSVGLDQMGSVNTETGFFQVFVRNTIYDGRMVVVPVDGKSFSVAYMKYGLPLLLDGTKALESPQDLHFWKPALLYQPANPSIPVPMDFKNLEKESVYVRYPSGFDLTPVDLLLIHNIGEIHIDIFSGYQYWLKWWWVVSSWLESEVGQVIQGYVRDQNENIILNGFKVIITTTYAFGWDTLGYCDPLTGWYELFVKSIKYDNRWLMAHLNTGRTFDIAYRKYGLPALIDGTAPLVSPQDLHFWIPSQICGKSVAYVGSLVTY
jgi:hypothetical protein